MNLTARDRRALSFLAVSAILSLIYYFWPSGGTTAVVAPAGDSIALEEKRLAKLREVAATVPSKEEILKGVSAELAIREKGLIKADTAPQAQAQLVQLVRTLGRAEAPPIDIRNTEFGGVRPLGDAYGEAVVSLQIECRIDQLVNLLAAISNQPELISTSDLRVSASNMKEKTVNVRLTVAGVVPRKLVPDKKGAVAF